jgi:hypothetical protein
MTARRYSFGNADNGLRVPDVARAARSEIDAPDARQKQTSR